MYRIFGFAVVPAAAERAKGPPAEKLTDLVLSSSPFIGDELQLSEEDWAKMDALTSRAEQRGASRLFLRLKMKHILRSTGTRFKSCR
jgi:hypothetical protein